MSNLLGIAERCEQATGLDRELDCAIYNAIPDGPNRKAERLPMERWGDRFDDGWRTMWADREDKYPEKLKRYTASLDAAMTLVPEGMYPIIDCDPRMIDPVEIYRVGEPIGAVAMCFKAATPALALCAGALRARAAIADRNPQGGDVKQAPSRSDESGGSHSEIAQNEAKPIGGRTT